MNRMLYSYYRGSQYLQQIVTSLRLRHGATVRSLRRSSFSSSCWQSRPGRRSAFPLKELVGAYWDYMYYVSIYVSMLCYLCGGGSKPIINSNGMNIHLPAILGFTRGTSFWPIAMSKYVNIPVPSLGAAGSPLWSRAESGQRQPRHTATSEAAAGPAAGPGGHGAGANVGWPWWVEPPQWEERNELNHVESIGFNTYL